MAIRCKTCGQSNQDGVRFCGECGTQLVFESNAYSEADPNIEHQRHEQDYPSQAYQNQGYQNPGYQNPGYQNPGYQNPGYQNPTQNPGYAQGQGTYPPPGHGNFAGQGQAPGGYPPPGQGGYQGQGQYGNQGYYGQGAAPNPGYQGGAYHSGPYQNGPYPGGPQGSNYGYGGYGYGYNPEWPIRSRIVAALLAIFAGGLGIHKFYLGRTVQGIFYILFSWTLIPSLISFFEGIGYLFSSDEAFSRRYMVRVDTMR